MWYNNIIMMAARLIKEARLRAGLSQHELAVRAGRKPSAIGRWERGEVSPSFETVAELIRACDLDITISITTKDSSYLHDVRERLRLPVDKRVERALSESRQAQTIRREVAATKL